VKVVNVRITLLSPTIISIKKGKGHFYVTTEYIPSSTLLGAISRKAVLENIQQQRGNCKNIKTLNELPDCKTCDEDCFYKRIWVKGNLKIRPAFYSPKEQSNITTIPPLPTLESLFCSRYPPTEYKDGLLGDFVFKEVIGLSLSEIEKLEGCSLISLLDKLNFTKYKRNKGTVMINNGKLQKLDLQFSEFSHCAIDSRFKTSKRGYLFARLTLAKNSVFKTIAIAPTDLIQFMKGEYFIGMGKARGFGHIKIEVDTPIDRNTYVEERTKQIEEGLKKINDLLLSSSDTMYGTISGLSPLSFNEDDPLKAINKRLDPQNLDKYTMKTLFYRISPYKSFLQDTTPTFRIEDVIASGYAGVFQIKSHETLLKTAEDLAQLEFNLNSYPPWFGWIYINHPIHYQFSTIER